MIISDVTFRPQRCLTDLARGQNVLNIVLLSESDKGMLMVNDEHRPKKAEHMLLPETYNGSTLYTRSTHNVPPIHGMAAWSD